MVTQRFAVPDVTPRPQPGLRGVAIVLSSVLAILVDQTSTTIVSTGLPYLQAITVATPDQASWILTWFNAAYYASILFSPWMMARVGRKTLIVTALLGYAATSLVLTVTSDFIPFVFLRFVQGACLGCIFVPAAVLLFTSLSPSVLRFAPPAFVLVSLSGSTLGTVIGGFLADEFGGSAVFVPGCIVTVLTAALIYFAVDTKDKPQPALRLDFIGLTLSVVSFAAGQYLANEGERRNWFDDGSVLLAAGALALALPSFVLYELFVTREPHVDFRMFAKHRNLSVGGVINIAIGSVGYSVTIFVGYLQAALGATPTVAGAMILVRLTTYVIGVPAAFALITSRRLDLRAVVILAVLGSSLGLLVFSHLMTPTAEVQTFVGVSLLFGFFFGMLNQPMGALVIGSMPLPLLAAGVSIYKLSSPVGLMIATGGMQALLDHRTADFRSQIAAGVSLSSPSVDRYVREHHGNLSGLTAIVAAQAQTLAYSSMMLLLAAIILVVVPLVFLAKIQKPRPAPTDV